MYPQSDFAISLQNIDLTKETNSHSLDNMDYHLRQEIPAKNNLNVI